MKFQDDGGRAAKLLEGAIWIVIALAASAIASAITFFAGLFL